MDDQLADAIIEDSGTAQCGHYVECVEVCIDCQRCRECCGCEAATNQRFILIEDQPEDFPITDDTWWWWDTKRAAKGESFVGRPFVAKEVYKGDDPNDFVQCKNMTLLFTDQAEYYAVCQKCRVVYGHMQWSGSTYNPNWRQRSQDYLEKHKAEKGWCEFCDPIFGNGGWYLGGS